MDNFIIRKILSKRGSKYKYDCLDKRNNKILNKQIIKDAKKGLYIPPAYDNVKINLCKDAKFSWDMIVVIDHNIFIIKT